VEYVILYTKETLPFLHFALYLQNSRATEQQSNRATEQQSNRATEQTVAEQSAGHMTRLCCHVLARLRLASTFAPTAQSSVWALSHLHTVNTRHPPVTMCAYVDRNHAHLLDPCGYINIGYCENRIRINTCKHVGGTRSDCIKCKHSLTQTLVLSPGRTGNSITPLPVLTSPTAAVEASSGWSYVSVTATLTPE
jgi:hypothetical protein